MIGDWQGRRQVDKTTPLRGSVHKAFLPMVAATCPIGLYNCIDVVSRQVVRRVKSVLFHRAMPVLNLSKILNVKVLPHFFTSQEPRRVSSNHASCNESLSTVAKSYSCTAAASGFLHAQLSRTFLVRPHTIHWHTHNPSSHAAAARPSGDRLSCRALSCTVRSPLKRDPSPSHVLRGLVTGAVIPTLPTCFGAALISQPFHCLASLLHRSILSTPTLLLASSQHL